jgi:hypothetical protein
MHHNRIHNFKCRNCCLREGLQWKAHSPALLGEDLQWKARPAQAGHAQNCMLIVLSKKIAIPYEMAIGILAINNYLEVKP